jgi:hypothetical protein
VKITFVGTRHSLLVIILEGSVLWTWRPGFQRFPGDDKVIENMKSTVPFHSIRQSRVTGLLKMLKCHGCHGGFRGVPNSF